MEGGGRVKSIGCVGSGVEEASWLDKCGVIYFDRFSLHRAWCGMDSLYTEHGVALILSTQSMVWHIFSLHTPWCGIASLYTQHGVAWILCMMTLDHWFEEKKCNLFENLFSQILYTAWFGKVYCHSLHVSANPNPDYAAYTNIY